MSNPCAGQTELFYSYDPRDLKVTRAICNSCPVKVECREGAKQRRENHGVWGGRTAVELAGDRRREQRRRRLQVAS